MARAFFGFVLATIVVGSSHRDVSAHDDIKSREGQDGPKPQKAKLFEVPGLNGKISHSAFGEVFDALRDKRVQQEILLPSQLKDLLRLSEDAMKELGATVEIFNKLPKAEQAAKVEQLQKDLASYMKSVEADVDKILLPEQQQRLRQVAFQLRLEKFGSIATVTSPDVLRELGLNNDQIERFRESLKRIEEQHRNKLAELETERERRILALFSPNQKDRLEWMIGNSMRKATVRPKAPRP